ncbi:LEAF RUST 10 DISEASE-RESISTANCE LOCUS RECEPTOR-LIKE PROTEIN KINASE-like 2.8 [Alnus glutinosa]|uniref:LEAF RUST 10 DISEASE-RESISTANCE LOCUS RECEPTOR-LIKE PROTEIN KINASE-like 2.8 n=1 Tax=Alnus glutinosa TaxID=3517 RepID=UPI002D76A1AE|nr:LEAF RUST 10 DISEASE-RESISTANCE LOCUS RECEPTOR-LIKE PROTEIN KINASE-like 2.8 [Alnus glutinosa]
MNKPSVVCNRPYNCGSLINIPYPFWGDSRPEYCGQHGYNLNCRNNEYPVLRFEALEFRVLNINTSTRTFTIARSDICEGPCALLPEFHNTTLNSALFDYASTVQDITLLYDCPPPQDNIPPAPNRFNCSQFEVSDGKSNALHRRRIPLGHPASSTTCSGMQPHSIKVPILRSARALLEDPEDGAPEVVRTSKGNESRF